ncbi:restriction endonuclease subunit S [Acetobacter indonesiensis]|uniref:restriction endonuclease subunit S n=1 Tax=Acetobacter indonesiensis TaxID=104101 RepID=UPI0020A2A869|nr:restriction endonuclease subunit S [Acetobacter indonesiensis]
MSFGENINQLIEYSENPHLQIHPSWERVRLGDIADILNGAPWKSQYFNSTDGVPMIRIRDVTSGATNTRYNGPTNDGPWVEPGDLLVGMDGDFNVRRWKSHKGLLNQRVCKISISKSLYSSRFIEYILPSYLAVINQATSSVTVKHLSSRTLNDLPIPLPPLAEQRRIVAKLDSLTARITRARAELERAKRLQKQWFSKFLDSEFSCDGELLRLGELAEDVRYGTAQKCDYNPTLTPVLRIPNIASGNIDTSDLKHSTFTEKEIKKLSLCSGDLLIVRSNGSIDLVGQSAVADTQVSGFLFAGYLIRIRLKNKEVTPYFVHYWLRSPQARSAINAAAKSTSGVNNINSEQLKNLQIKIPSLSKQRIIVSRVIKAFSHADRLETEAERVLALLDRLESSLLAKAFRGELVPQDPDDEPASVLLDRIQAERAAAPKPKRGRKQSTQDMPVPRKRQTEKHG